MKQNINNINETIYADVDYINDRGEFDFRKFADAAGATITKKNKDKAYQQLLDQQKKWDQQRQKIRSQQQKVKSREVIEDKRGTQALILLYQKKKKLEQALTESKLFDQQIDLAKTPQLPNWQDAQNLIKQLQPK